MIKASVYYVMHRVSAIHQQTHLDHPEAGLAALLKKDERLFVCIYVTWFCRGKGWSLPDVLLLPTGRRSLSNDYSQTPNLGGH